MPNNVSYLRIWINSNRLKKQSQCMIRMKVLLFLSILSASFGFVPTAKQKPQLRTKTRIGGSFNPFNIDDRLGDPLIYSDMFNDEKLNSIQSVSIMPDGKTAYAIDKIDQMTKLTSHNIHKITLNPDTVGNMAESLVSHDVDVTNVSENTSILVSFLAKFGETVFNIAVFMLVFSLITRFLSNSITSASGLNSLSRIDAETFVILQPNSTSTTFSDVAGCDEAKTELTEVVDFLRNTEKYTEIGAKIPKGVLLEGNPGTGKTLMARAIAGEAGVPFISTSGSEFIEMFVGVGASRVRKLFDKAKELSPCVIFIDEIDAVGRQRGAGIAGGNDEREQTLNQILTNMDGFSESEGIIVVAATNRMDILDNALIRPGRFDRKVNVPLPSLEGRKSIFEIHLKKKKVASDTTLDDLASLTTGFSGADIANLANEAAIIAVRNNVTQITNEQLFKAYEKITIGINSNKQEGDPDIVEMVSYHECGHALMVAIFDDMFDLKKITINGNTNGVGGYTLFTPKEKFMKFATKRFMLANLIIALGGRAAEVFLYKDIKGQHAKKYNGVFDEFEDLDVTTGASNDLIQANKIARDYITKYGFGENINYYDSSSGDYPFIGKELSMSTEKISEPTKREIDRQTSVLVSYAFRKAYELIKLHRIQFNHMVETIKIRRTVDGKDLGLHLDDSVIIDEIFHNTENK
jgi:cell division protease FtsH